MLRLSVILLGREQDFVLRLQQDQVFIVQLFDQIINGAIFQMERWYLPIKKQIEYNFVLCFGILKQMRNI